MNKEIMTLYVVYELCRVKVRSVETVHTELFKSETALGVVDCSSFPIEITE